MIFKNLVSENTKKSKQICDQIYNQSLYNEEIIFNLLITTSEFESKIKDTFKNVCYYINVINLNFI